MPEAGLNRNSRDDSAKDIRPSLLEERRAWVRQDREVKLDIFLSLAEEVMQEVFEVGPPLPPSNLNAKELLDALDKHFTDFNFETYHHAFCHFLNLHIDQYATVEEFNAEFSTTLEDLLDYGQPLSNAQACSAYFSKLRCTQNPWVAKQLEGWHAQSPEPELVNLMKESPPWSCIRPLTTKTSQNFHVQTIPEESLEDNSIHSSDSESATGPSSVSTMSSRVSHSRHISSSTVHSQEITIHASSDDIAEIDSTLRSDLKTLIASAVPEDHNSRDHKSGFPPPGEISEFPITGHDGLNSKATVARMLIPAPIDRPLPPLPIRNFEMEAQLRPAVPGHSAMGSKNSSQASLTVPISSPAAQTLRLKLETTHPTLRPQTPSPPLQRLDFVSSSPNLAVPWPSTPDVPKRPHSSRAALPFEQLHQVSPQQHETVDPQHNRVSPELSPLPLPQLQRVASANSSIISLPLQGTRDSAWDYMYERKPSCREHSVSPIQSQSISPPSPVECDITALPQLKGTLSSAPTFDELTVVNQRPRPSKDESFFPKERSTILHAKSSSVDFMTRLSGDGLQEPSEEARERELAKKQAKKRSWSVNVNLSRFSTSKGVKEII